MNRPLRAAIAACALLVSGCAAPTQVAKAQAVRVQGSGRTIGGAPFSFASLVKRVVPAVVNITVTEAQAPADASAVMPPELRGTPFEKQFRDRFRGRREQVLGAGSGFIVDPSGLIVTNNHVVGKADKIIVALSDGTELQARLIGSDDLTDIAVIRVSSPTPLPYVVWGDSNAAEVGDWILAAGNPFGVGTSITAGIISARGRDIGAGPFDDFLQIDAPINPGNSGGPTFNMEGQVVAVNTHRRFGRHRLRGPQRDRPAHRRRPARQGAHRPRLARRVGAGRAGRDRPGGGRRRSHCRHRPLRPGRPRRAAAGGCRADGERRPRGQRPQPDPRRRRHPARQRRAPGNPPRRADAGRAGDSRPPPGGVA